MVVNFLSEPSSFSFSLVSVFFEYVVNDETGKNMSMYIISSSCYFLQVLFFMLTIQILVSRSDLDLDFLVFFLCLSFSWSPVLWYLRKYFGLEIIRL